MTLKPNGFVDSFGSQQKEGLQGLFCIFVSTYPYEVLTCFDEGPITKDVIILFSKTYCPFVQKAGCRRQRVLARQIDKSRKRPLALGSIVNKHRVPVKLTIWR